MRILLIVPDGVAIRNYLYSSFIEELENNGVEVIVYHQISKSAIVEIKKAQKGIKEFVKIPVISETIKARILRESLCYARLLRNKKVLNNNSILSFWNTNGKGFKQKLLYRVTELLGFVFSRSDRFLLKMDTVYNNEIKSSKKLYLINEDFDRLKPDMVLNLHQRAPLSAPVIEVAKARTIKTATVIFSWDNVPKARLISRYDDYLVWSDLMKKELKELYPEINSEAIKVVGSPQFEFYDKNHFYKSKSVFFNSYGLDSNKKTICYSSNDKSLPYDPNYLEDICEALMTLKERERPQVVFRISPVDKSDRFKKVLEKYKSIVFPITPDWRTDNEDKESFTSIYPAYNDIELLVNTVNHCDVVVNLGSTMAHDFAVLDKPCLYLKYDPVVKPKIKTETIFNFQHFKSMENIDAVGWILDKSEIILKIQQAFKQPKAVGKDRTKWLDTIVKYRETASKEIVKQLTK